LPGANEKITLAAVERADAAARELVRTANHKK
jgi:hypothetical protein